MKAPSFFLRIVLAAAFGAVLASCASAPKEIPEGMSAQILVQRAQESSDAYNYDAALAYYKALKERYGADSAYDCAADYEMAFIAYKQGRVDEAKAGLSALLERYAQPGGDALPPQYRILAARVLENMEAQKKPGE
jgi:outer membrane protein assembly factor BamD (BamD/ComL family)